MEALTGNLGELLGAVSFAMVASLLGVLLTIVLGLLTRRAVARVDERRNAFFTFYQIKFLPRITRDVNAVLSSLNGTLDRFNTQFGGNVEAMQQSFGDNRAAIEEQQRVLEAMRQLSVGGALEGTVELYKEISEGTRALEKLTPHIERIHSMMKAVGDSGSVHRGYRRGHHPHHATGRRPQRGHADLHGEPAIRQQSHGGLARRPRRGP